MKFRSLLSLVVATGSVFLTEAVCFASEGGQVDPLYISKDIAFWTTVVFFLTLLVLGKFAWKPIIEGLDKREKGIADNIAQAEKQNEEAKATLEKYKAELANAKTEVANMIEDAKKSAQKSGQLILDKAKADAEAEVKKSKAEIEQAKKEAMQTLADNAADLALVLAGKICQKDLDKAAHAQLINSAVENFSKQAL